MTSLIIRQQHTPLVGTITVPGDKSISHRALLLGALAEGTGTVENWLPAGDTLATLNAVQALGVDIDILDTRPRGWRLLIKGRGLRGLEPPGEPIFCANAGTCMRLLTGILAGQTFASTVDGSPQLRARPMRRIVEPLREMGADIDSQDGRAPLSLRPAPLRGAAFILPVASAQVKSAILLAGLYAEGATRVREPGPARDHTERMLQAMGVDLVEEESWISLAGPVDRLNPIDLEVPGDFSSAAFPLVAAALVQDSHIALRDVGNNGTRQGLLDLLLAMGASIAARHQRLSGGEAVADLTASAASLQGMEVKGDLVVRAIDELPVWTVAATQAKGQSLLRDAAELRVKEVDRIGVLAAELGKLGANIVERADGFVVTGPSSLVGATVSSHGDHRLGMALAVAGLVAEGVTVVEEANCINDSFPGFVETMRELGAEMAWEEEV